MLRTGLLIVYCTAIGFVAAGIAASFYRMVTTEPARFVLLGRSWPGLVSTFLFFALSGPAIIAGMIYDRLRERDRNAWLVAGVAVAALWSVCSGILMVGLIVSLQEALAWA